ncbi:MAG: hypothetical protein LBJ67_12860 [Planctomycetaceae bacterium]|nr:hypothetical protein [Planctomycetaceae bacterium]
MKASKKSRKSPSCFFERTPIVKNRVPKVDYRSTKAENHSPKVAFHVPKSRNRFSLAICRSSSLLTPVTHTK